MGNNIVSEKTIGDSISLEILISKTRLPPLPAHITKLMEMARQPMDNIEIGDFAKLVETDPGLFASVLKLANSPYYGGVDKIITLRTAITRIGLSETINSVCLFCLKKILPQLPSIDFFSAKDYWAYSWACAVANRRLGHPNLALGINAGELYLAGLLHGMGKLLLAIHYPDEFLKCLKLTQKFNQPLYKAELEILGTTDAFIASKIMETWNLPVNICAGVAFYQRPESAPREYRVIAGLTQMAYSIAALSGIGSSGENTLPDLCSLYICQQPNLSISKETVRGKLIEEILNSLAEKSESVTGVPASKSNTVQISRKPPNHGSPAKKVSTQESGVFARIMSFFAR